MAAKPRSGAGRKGQPTRRPELGTGASAGFEPGSGLARGGAAAPQRDPGPDREPSLEEMLENRRKYFRIISNWAGLPATCAVPACRRRRKCSGPFRGQFVSFGTLPCQTEAAAARWNEFRQALVDMARARRERAGPGGGGGQDARPGPGEGGPTQRI